MSLKELGTAWDSVGLEILGLGRGLPEHPVTNDDMERLVDTSDEWIRSRTGIETRYFCWRDRNQLNLDLAEAAARQALARAGVSPEELGLCLVSTFTPDTASPTVACGLHGRLGLPEDTFVYDINAACAGFIYGLQTARQLLLGARRPYALVVGSETISRVLDYCDRSTCVLFGDGAGAAVVRLKPGTAYYGCCGSRADAEGWLGCWDGFVHMQGPEVFRFAVDIIPRCIEELLEKSGLELEDIDHVVCHQANRRIINHVVKKLAARQSQFFVNVQKYANTSSASIPLALCDMWEQGLLRRGDKVIMVAFGAGFTWSACLLEY